ncbi:MAG: amidohydrolase family protein [Clostridiales bacterium]|nr:amidohydrolase family protein [Clostridiales bacterium]
MIISADRILVGDRSTIVEGKAVCMQGGRIKMIAPLKDVKNAFPGEDIVEYPGCTIMPGMIDLHTHIACVPDPDYYHKYNTVSLCALYAAGRMRDTLAAGVTTIRDSSSAYGIGAALKKAAADGHIDAPRIFACLQGICMTGGHGSDSLEGGVIEADGENEVRKAVRLNYKNGADCIKVLTSEGYRGQEMNQEELNAAAEEAHRFGLKAAAHAGYGDSIEMCIQAGFDSIEHGTHLTIDQAKRMKEKNITWVPTVLVFNYVYQQSQKNAKALGETLSKPSTLVYLEDCVKTYQENVKALYDTGVRVATGTDTDCTPYKDASPVALECEYLVKCGLTPMEAVECATKNGADYLGMGDCLGQIKEDYIADVIVVEGDPSKDITALGKVRAVYQAGKKFI